MAPSNPTNPSSSPAPATPKQASAPNASQTSPESSTTSPNSSTTSTSPSQAKPNSSNTDTEAETLRFKWADQTPTQQSQPITVLYSRSPETGQGRILGVQIGSTLHPPPFLQKDLTISFTDSSSNHACPSSPTTSVPPPPEP